MCAAHLAFTGLYYLLGHDVLLLISFNFNFTCRWSSKTNYQVGSANPGIYMSLKTKKLFGGLGHPKWKYNFVFAGAGELT